MKPQSFVLFLISTGCCFAQFTSGVEGTIADPSGAAVPGASVSVTNPATGLTRTAIASSSGYFRVSSLAASIVTVSVAASGFKTSVREQIELSADETRTINFTLEIGSAETKVTVVSDTPPIDLSEGRISGVIEQPKIRELPLVGRNVFTLVILTPGVTGLANGGGQSFSSTTGDIFTTEYGVGLGANGLRSQGNNFLVDSGSTNDVSHGGVTNLSPNAESVQEIKIQANTFSAEYGRGNSVVVNVITKQGTNALHGSATWFFTNNHLSAHDEFTAKVPVLRRNEAAWSLGGPIIRNRTFFFASMDILRSGVAQARAVRLETPQFLDFLSQNRPNAISTGLLKTYPAEIVPVRNFSTVGNLINTNCATLSSPSALVTTVAGSMPCNLPVTGEGNFQTTLPRNGIQYNGRIDHLINRDRDRLYGSFFYTTLDHVFNDAAQTRQQFTRIQSNYTQFINMNETHIFSPAIINELGASWMRPYIANPCGICEIPGTNIVGVEGFALPGSQPGPATFNNYDMRDTVSINRGSHSIRTGIDVQQNQEYDNYGEQILRPIYGFNNILDFAADKPFSQGNVGIDPATGLKAASALRYPASRDGIFGLFVQDDWKAKPNFSLSLGLRWEDFGNPRHRHNSTTNVIFQGGNDFNSRIANAKVDYTPNHHLLADADHNNFGPRFGFAWDPFKEGATSVRGGAGMFYTRLTAAAFNQTQSNPPRVGILTVTQQTPGAQPVFGLGTPNSPYNFPLPTGFLGGLDAKNGLRFAKANVSFTDPNIRTAYSYNWFLGVQHSFAKDWVVEANYIGSSGHKLYSSHLDVNRFAGDLIQNNGVLQRLNTSFGPMAYTRNLFNSIYTGSTFAVRKRFGQGISFDSAVTLGHAQDGGFVGGNGNESFSRIADINNLKAEYGSSSFDVARRFSLNVLWEIPGPRQGPGAFRAVLSHWELSGITVLQSGAPFSVNCTQPFIPVRNAAGVIVGNNGCDFNADGNNYDYPNAPTFGKTLSGLSRSNYIIGLFKATDFPKPALGQEGNLGRSEYRNPGYADTDLVLARNQNVPWFGGDPAQLQFRVEMFNAFNRVNLGSVTDDMASPLFGRSTSAFPARSVQFGLKLRF